MLLLNKSVSVFSKYKLIEQGVRQGGIISPFLFNFYIDKVINNISSLKVGCKLGFIRTNIILYAYDVILLVNDPEDLNYIYFRFKALIDDLKLKINETF